MSAKKKVQVKMTLDEYTYLSQVAQTGGMSVEDLLLRSTRFVISEMHKASKTKDSPPITEDDDLTEKDITG